MERPKLLAPFGGLAKDVGRARVPPLWRGASLSIPVSYVDVELASFVLTGEKQEEGNGREPPVELQEEISSIDLSGNNLGGIRKFIYHRNFLRDRLVHLHLRYAKLDVDDMISISARLPESIQSYSLSGNKLGDYGAKELFQKAGFPLLQVYELGLADCDIGDPGLEVVCSRMRESSNLTSLYLNHNRISDIGCIYISCDLLRTRYDQLAKDGILAQLENQTLSDEETIELLLSQSETRLPPLKTLDLSNNFIRSVRTLHDLLQAAEHKVSLVEFVFHGNGEDALEPGIFTQAHLDPSIQSSLTMLLAEPPGSQVRKKTFLNAFVRDFPSPCIFHCGIQNVCNNNPEAKALHFEIGCAAQPTNCQHCKLLLPNAKMEEHWIRDCPECPRFCRLGCGFAVSRREEDNGDKPSVEVHEREFCQLRKHKCPLECGLYVEVGDKMLMHQESECEMRMVPCEYGSHGCIKIMHFHQIEAHHRAHREELAKKFIGREAPRRDELGTENSVARDLMSALDKLCESIGRSGQERQQARKDRAAANQAENQHLRRFFSEKSKKERMIQFDQAKVALKTWFEVVPRLCAHGCKVKLAGVAYEQHFVECPHRLVICDLDCGERIKQQDLNEHQEIFCPERLVRCHYRGCGLNIKAKERDDHVRTIHVKK